MLMTKIVLKSNQDSAHKLDSNTCTISKMIILVCFHWDFEDVLTAELQTILVRETAHKLNQVILTDRDFCRIMCTQTPYKKSGV